MVEKVRYNSQPFLGGDEDSQRGVNEIREFVESQRVDVDDVRVMFDAMISKNGSMKNQKANTAYVSEGGRAQSAFKVNQDYLLNSEDEMQIVNAASAANKKQLEEQISN